MKDLLTHPAALAEVPLFLVALLIVRGVPALLYARAMGGRRAAAGGLLQATTLTFVIVATEIGLATGTLTPTVSAALVAAGLLSAALFPVAAARMLAHVGQGKEPTTHAAGSAAGRQAEKPSSQPGSQGQSAYRSPWRRPCLSVRRAARRLRRTDST